MRAATAENVGQYLNFLKHLPHNQSKCLSIAVCKVSTVQQNARVIICVSCIIKLDHLVFLFLQFKPPSIMRYNACFEKKKCIIV